MNAHALAVSIVVAVASTVALVWVTRPADDAVLIFSRRVNSVVAVVLIAAGIGASLTFGVYLGIITILGSYLLVRGLKLWYERYEGGITGFGLILALALTTALPATILTRLQQLW